MRSTRLPWCVHLSLISPACQYPQDAVGPPEASDSSQTSVPDPETIAPTTTTGPATRFTDGLAATGFPYARRDGVVIAKDLTSLFAKSLTIPLDITETGEKLPPGELAWTNLSGWGAPVSPTEHCQAWTSASYKDIGGVGQISPADDSDLALFSWRLGDTWTRHATDLCKNEDRHVYCFEN